MIKPDCTKHTNSAYFALNKSFQDLQDAFFTKGTYMRYNVKDRVIEIKIEDTSIILLFDENNICDSSFILPDNANEIEYYIKYYNKSYPYDYVYNGWIINDACLNLNSDKDGTYFMLLPMQK